VKAATGRTLTISGAPRIVLWPELSIEADDAVLSNPPGLYHGQLAAIPRLRLKIDAGSLFARRLEVKQLTLVNPRITLVSDGEGRANWAFAAAGSSSAAAAAYRPLLDSIASAPIRIENGVVRFVDERTGRTVSLTGADLMASFGTSDSPFAVHGYVLWNGQRVAMTLFIKDPARIPGQGSPIDVTLDSPLLKFSFSGRAVLNREASLSGTAELSSTSLRELSGWTGFRLGSGRGLGPFAASGSFDLTNGVVSLSKTVMALDGMNGQGNIKIDLTGDKPRVTAALGIDRLDMNIYGGIADRSQPSQSADDWSDRELDFSPLRAIDANLSFAASELRIGGLRTGKANIAAELGGGVLDLTIKDTELYGGKASGRLVLNGSRPVPAVQAAIRAESVEGAPLLAGAAGLDTLTGTTSMTLSLAGIGRSEREVVSTLRGTAEFRMLDGALRDISLMRMLREVRKDILAGWQPAADSRTVFRELSATFALEDGIATSSDLQLVAPELTITGSGQADLLRRALDFKVVPKLAAGPAGEPAASEAALAVPLVVKGPWGSPKIYPDIAGILENPRAGYDTLNKLRAPASPLQNDGRNFDAATREKVKATLSDRSKGSFGAVGDAALGDNDSLLKGFLDEAAPASGSRGSRQ
jgi:AsmA protein